MVISMNRHTRRIVERSVSDLAGVVQVLAQQIEGFPLTINAHLVTGPGGGATLVFASVLVDAVQ